jgi:hypothetical protein
MKPYKLVMPRRRARVEVPNPRIKTTIPPVPATKTILIQGKVPGSIQEVWVAWAFVTLREPFQYQVVLYGGKQVRGGQVLDFLLTRFNTPVQVFGDRWHSLRTAEDAYNLSVLETLYGVPPVVLWGHELTSPEATLITVRRKLHL